MRLIMLVARTLSGGIGRDGHIPWMLKDDLKGFRDTTMGGTLIMGRVTYESIPSPLEGRKVIVLSHQDMRDKLRPNARCTDHWKTALALAQPGQDKVFIVGGEEVYRAYLPFTHEVHETLVLTDTPCDRFFDNLDYEHWTRHMGATQEANERNAYPFLRSVLVRKADPQPW